MHGCSCNGTKTEVEEELYTVFGVVCKVKS